MNNKSQLSGSGVIATGSQPDLRNMADDPQFPNSNLRFKRKTPDSHDINEEIISLHEDVDAVHKELKDFRTEIKTLMDTFLQGQTRQTETVNQINESISGIKNEMKDISDNIEKLAVEQRELDVQIQKLNTKSEIMQGKIKSLEDNVSQFKNIPEVCDEIIQETQERMNRSKNVILLGIPEAAAALNAPERRLADKNEVIKILKPLLKSEDDVLYVFRLGKYTTGKNRNVKVCLASENAARSILRNKANIGESTFKIFSDQTAYQQKHLNNLKDQLKQRTNNGENNLRIKYVRGVPKIMEAEPKN
ncbi:hypothetical protein O0L34_g12724 [Tuta absoluta]|nr:hypothetical protein O0L34_g12724 [Tuta absoluta]